MRNIRNAIKHLPRKVEHKIRELKIFRILKETYRNFRRKYNMRFNIIAGIVNYNAFFLDSRETSLLLLNLLIRDIEMSFAEGSIE